MAAPIPATRVLFPNFGNRAFLAIAALLLGLAAAGIWMYQRSRTSTAPTYQTTTVSRGNIAVSVSATGPISSASTIPLNFKQTGQIAQILVAVGQQVKAGQLLVKEDTRDLEATLAQAQASLANAQANYDKLVQGATPQQIAVSQAAINAAQTNLADAQKNLVATQASTAADLQSAQNTVQSQQTALGDAQKNLAAVQQQIDKGTAADQTAVANAQAALNDAKRNLATAVASANSNLPVLQQQLAKARNDVWAAQANRDATCAGRNSGPGSCDAANAQVAAAQTEIDQANAQILQSQAQSANSLSTAQAAVTTATNNLKSAQDTLASDLAKFQGQLVAAQTQLNQAAANLKSAQDSLHSTQVKDAASLQSVQAQVNNARSSLATAQANYQQTVAPPTQADVDAAKAQIEQARASVQTAQLNLDAATLVAPTDGTINQINGAVGQWVSGGPATSSTSPTTGAVQGVAPPGSTPGGGVILMSDLSRLQIVAQVNEADMSRVKIGDKVTFNVDAYGTRNFTGRVVAIQPLGVNVSNVINYNVTIDVDPSDARLLPGMTANVNLVTDERDNVLVVPNTALAYARNQFQANRQAQGASGGPAKAGGASGQGGSGAKAGQGGQGQGGTGGAAGAKAGQGAGGGLTSDTGFVVVMRNGVPNPARIRIGLSDGRNTEVVSGLSEGEVVITGQSGGAGSSGSSGTSNAPKVGPANPFGPAPKTTTKGG